MCDSSLCGTNSITDPRIHCGRYLAICKPLKYRATTSRAKRFIALSWILAFFFAIPQLFIFVQTVDVRSDGTMEFGCKSRGYTNKWQRKVYFTFMTLYILVIPVALITFCYTRYVRVGYRSLFHFTFMTLYILVISVALITFCYTRNVRVGYRSLLH